MKPLKLIPAVKDYIWGGTRLSEEYGVDSSLAIQAEAWVLSCHKDGESVVSGGRYDGMTLSEVIREKGKEEGKYQLDLQETNRRILLAAGVLPENIAVTDICTCCNSELLFSHRGSNGKRGNLGAFLELRKS